MLHSHEKDNLQVEHVQQSERDIHYHQSLCGSHVLNLNKWRFWKMIENQIPSSTLRVAKRGRPASSKHESTWSSISDGITDWTKLHVMERAPITSRSRSTMVSLSSFLVKLLAQPRMRAWRGPMFIPTWAIHPEWVGFRNNKCNNFIIYTIKVLTRTSLRSWQACLTTLVSQEYKEWANGACWAMPRITTSSITIFSK